MKHILLKNLNHKKIQPIEPFQDYYYNKTDGAWVSIQFNSLLVKHKNFPAIGSKKKDIETGEDQK